MVNFSFKSKPVFNFLPVMDSENLPISRMELFMTIANKFQLLAIVVKVSERAYDCQRWLLALLIFLTSFRLFFQHIGSILDGFKSRIRWTFCFQQKYDSCGAHVDLCLYSCIRIDLIVFGNVNWKSWTWCLEKILFRRTLCFKNDLLLYNMVLLVYLS